MKKLFIILGLGMLLTSCGTIHRGTDVAGNKVKVFRNNEGRIVKQIHECENKKIIIVYNR